ncbi:hypothetical protein BJ875DRAFT_282507 [Amylocarpus encephaloides]|uniref:Uncharacterized protein n=1 Tax=Amylocarpus encephaloides TaxID=45428 RepID=A0A9P7YJM2_9HELO|nr:hypothetical protein BJ875DRAFT_282507 [Amylocarpus encephaloides]
MSTTNSNKPSKYKSLNSIPELSPDTDTDTDIETQHQDDIANDSDTTLASATLLNPHSQACSSSPKSQRQLGAERNDRTESLFTWLRWGVVIFMQFVIIILLLPTSGLMELEDLGLKRKWDGMAMTETGGDVNGLYVPTKHKYTLLMPDEEKFVPNMTDDSNRMEIRKNWDMLMPLGSGSVEIKDYQSYPFIGLPITDDPIRNGSLFEASWTHALHCLYYTVDSYHMLTVSNGTRFGFDGKRNDYHAAHCFEYLRNQILCMSDMTLEGSQSVLNSTGDGQAHMCRDRSEAIEWIESKRVDDIQSIVGP